MEKYRIDWVAQLYKKGDVRITMFYLLYGAKGPLIGT